MQAREDLGWKREGWERVRVVGNGRVGKGAVVKGGENATR